MSTNPFNPWALIEPDSRGPVSARPWRTLHNVGVEDFEAWSHGELIGQSADRADPVNPWIAVTCGALYAAEIGGAYMRGRIEPTDEGAFRALAYGYAAAEGAPVQWTDQTIDYRFTYRAAGLDGVNPGFKAFARYQDEDNLYVASWRFDGVIQIQRKQAGVYTTLIMVRGAAPASGVWHRLRFSAIGDVLELSLDGHVVVAVVDGTFAWGVVGIRTDATPGAYLDDLRVS